MVAAGARRAIRLLAIASASVAALVFLQTLVLQALSYDSPSFPTFVVLFRLAFFAADVIAFVGLVQLARNHDATRPFVVSALGLECFAVASGALGIVAHLMGPPSRSERLLKNFTATMSASEPAITLGISLLVAFALGAMVRAKPTASPQTTSRAATLVWIAFLFATSLWLFVTLARFSSRDAHTITVAWMVWGLEIGKSLVLASYAFVVWRALSSPSAASDATKDGPYRAEGEGPAAVAALPAAPDPATIAPLRRAASGMSLYSTGFAIRIGVAIVLTPLTLMAGSGELWFVYLLLPAAGVVTATLMAIGLGRQRVLPSFRAGGRLTASAVLMWITVSFDAFVVLGILLAATSGSSWSARRKAQNMLEMGFPTSALFFGIAILLVASTLARVGETFDQASLTRRARWAQSLALLVFVLGLALLFAVTAINGHDYDQKNGGALVAGALSIASLVALIAFVVMHILSQAEATRMLRFRLGLAR